MLISFSFLKGQLPLHEELLEHVFPCGNKCLISYTGNRLKVEIPFFLSDNLFFCFHGNSIFISDRVDALPIDLILNIEADSLLRQEGYLPLSSSRFESIYSFCSYLTYEFYPQEVKVTPNFPDHLYNQSYNMDDVIDLFKHALYGGIQPAGDTLIVPLSGGMDSRLIADLATRLPEKNCEFFTVGVKGCGDLAIANKVVAALGGGRHHVKYLEDVNISELERNYAKASFAVPMDRLLGHNVDTHISEGTILSGIYGDVIFGDNIGEVNSFSRYMNSQGINAANEIDALVINAYDCLPPYEKLYRILLRCQKLTKVSLHVLNNGFRIISPFLNDSVVAGASILRQKNMYPSIVRRVMRRNLANIIHQSSLSYFTHPPIMRVCEKRFLKVARRDLAIPYFNEEYLSSLGLEPDDCPPPFF